MNSPILQRRDVFKGLLAFSAAGALTACLPSSGGEGSSTDSQSQSDALLKYAAPDRFFDTKEMAFIGALSQTIIPKTDTAGAVEAGVPDTLQVLASDWGDDNFRRYWRMGLNGLKEKFLKQSGQPFVDISPMQQLNLLSRFDEAVFTGAKDPGAPKVNTDAETKAEKATREAKEQEQMLRGFYRAFKATVVDAYYKSEPGASEELAYEAVPGEWIGCVDLADYPKTWAT